MFDINTTPPIGNDKNALMNISPFYKISITCIEIVAL